MCILLIVALGQNLPNTAGFSAVFRAHAFELSATSLRGPLGMGFVEVNVHDAGPDVFQMGPVLRPLITDKQERRLNA